MRSTFAMFVTYLVVIAAGLVVFTALGFARGRDDPAPGAVVDAFARALQEGDGAAACALLTEDAQSQVEKERKKPCEQGIVEMKDDVAPGAAPSRIDVAEKSAIVETTPDDAVFLDKTPAGWRIGATGCRRQAGFAPYDCELEG